VGGKSSAEGARIKALQAPRIAYAGLDIGISDLPLPELVFFKFLGQEMRVLVYFKSFSVLNCFCAVIYSYLEYACPVHMFWGW